MCSGSDFRHITDNAVFAGGRPVVKEVRAVAVVVGAAVIIFCDSFLPDWELSLFVRKFKFS